MIKILNTLTMIFAIFCSIELFSQSGAQVLPQITSGQQSLAQPVQQPAQQSTQSSGQFVYNTDYKSKDYNATIGLVNYLSAIGAKNLSIKGFYLWIFHNKYGGLYCAFKDDLKVSTAHYESLSFGYVYPVIQDAFFVYGGLSYVKTRVFPDFYLPGYTSYREDKQYTLDLGVNIYYKWIGIFSGFELKNSYYQNNRVYYIGISLRGF